MHPSALQGIDFIFLQSPNSLHDGSLYRHCSLDKSSAKERMILKSGLSEQELFFTTFMTILLSFLSESSY